MKAICTDGTEIECKNFKAVEGGVLLTRDKKRKTVFGFVPNTNLAYVLPDDVAPARSSDEASPERDPPTDDAALRIPTGDEAESDEGEDAAEADEGDGATETDDGDGATVTETADSEERDATTAADDSVAGLVGGAPDATTLDPTEDLRRLAGLGDTYAERLRAAGLETVSDLRGQSVDEVVEIARVPRGRAERWLRLVTAREDVGTDASVEDDASSTAPDEAEASDSD